MMNNEFDDAILTIVDNDKNLKEIFNAKTYETLFNAYYERNQEIFETYCNNYSSNENNIEYARNIALKIMDHEMGKINAIKRKSSREMTMMNDSAFAALYMIPALVKTEDPGADVLADLIIEEWHKHFPDNQIQKGRFEEINAGFRKRRFCYITTAVCESKGKTDDCYELSMLRRYRDGWLSEQEHGAEWIEYYYETAPSIIARIDTRMDSEEIYDLLYDRYIHPCVRYIEDQEYNRCLNTYRQMVCDLENGKLK